MDNLINLVEIGNIFIPIGRKTVDWYRKPFNILEVKVYLWRKSLNCKSLKFKFWNWWNITRRIQKAEKVRKQLEKELEKIEKFIYNDGHKHFIQTA